MTVNVLWLFLTVPWAGLKCEIAVFPNHTHCFASFYLNLGVPLNIIPSISQGTSYLLRIKDKSAKLVVKYC